MVDRTNLCDHPSRSPSQLRIISTERSQAGSSSNVLSCAASLAMNDALQAAMLSPEMEFFPDLWAAAFDEIFAIRIGRLVVDHELGDLLGSSRDRGV
jgi:hypothetical protein